MINSEKIVKRLMARRIDVIHTDGHMVSHGLSIATLTYESLEEYEKGTPAIVAVVPFVREEEGVEFMDGSLRLEESASGCWRLVGSGSFQPNNL